jgi:hypothetical protein
MAQYQGYREPPLARSPTERTSWGGRDDNYRSNDREDNPRSDSFYRGRSPGMFYESRESSSSLCRAAFAFRTYAMLRSCHTLHCQNSIYAILLSQL